ATSNPTGSDATKPNPPSAMAGATGTTGSSAGTTGATGTTGSSDVNPNPASPSASPAASSADQNANAAAKSELAAIDAIPNKSRTGALTKTPLKEIARLTGGAYVPMYADENYPLGEIFMEQLATT